MRLVGFAFSFPFLFSLTFKCFCIFFHLGSTKFLFMGHFTPASG